METDRPDFRERVRAFADLRIIRVAGVGLMGVLCQTVVFEILAVWLKLLPPSTAVVVAAEVGVLVSFYLNDRFVFSDRRSRAVLAARLLRYHGVVSGSIFLQWLFVFTTERITSNYIALHAAYAAGIAVGFAWNYALYLFFVWRHRP